MPPLTLTIWSYKDGIGGTASPGRSGRRIWRNVFIDPRGPTPASGLLLVEECPESCTGTELRHSLDLDPDRLLGVRIEALARLALHRRERPKAGDLHLAAALDLAADGDEFGIDDASYLRARQRFVLRSIDELPSCSRLASARALRALASVAEPMGRRRSSSAWARSVHVRHAQSGMGWRRGTKPGAQRSASVRTAARPRWRTFPVPSSQRGCAPGLSCGTRPTHAHKEDTDGPSQTAARQG